MLCLKWNSVQRVIQGCRFWIQQLFPKIPSLKCLFWANLVPKRLSALFRRKLDTKEYSWVPILNSTIAFSNSFPTITFFGTFGLETSKCFVWNETQYKGCLVVLIPSSTVVFQISLRKIPFLRKFWSRNFKVLCFKQNPVQWDNQGWKFWTQFFYTFFFFWKQR